MPHSTLTDKGQTTVPIEVRTALRVKARQRLEWVVQPNGSALVRPQPSALQLFGSLKPQRPFPGHRKEKEAVRRAVAAQAAREGLR
ncbi:MAG TPA: type II toxin-antitoxin system PrlF family antitoxin [Candidatus Paceibacterota bacterium]|nr:type II toxin-antitoxin system PrlF family antitoxin [Verrucomicrobiota bacterium]HRZ47647.1 type II toxin-antitoxin system PrlF family antitoxin [Candidatus Paceibacterota bacterium]